MKTTETYVPYIMDDFEVGDRLYHYVGLNKGKLGRIHEILDTSLLVEMDDGTFETARIELFDEDSPYWEWDKLLDVNAVKIGSTLSRTEWGKRLFAKVTKVIPGEEIVVAYSFDLKAGKEPKRTVFKNPGKGSELTLEHLLMGWVLED